VPTCALKGLFGSRIRRGGEGMGRILTEGRGGGGILRLFYRFTLKLN